MIISNIRPCRNKRYRKAVQPALCNIYKQAVQLTPYNGPYNSLVSIPPSQVDCAIEEVSTCISLQCHPKPTPVKEFAGREDGEEKDRDTQIASK